MTTKMFPILGCREIQEIPWNLIEPFKENAIRNHDQSLERLASRGGLSVGEALAVFDGRPWGDAISRPGDVERLKTLVAQVTAAQLLKGKES